VPQRHVPEDPTSAPEGCFRYFRIVFEDLRATDAIQAAPVPKLLPGVYSNDPQFTETSTAEVLLLDALNTPLGDQKYVRLQTLVLS